MTQIFVLSANDLFNRDELTRTWTGIGQHQGAEEHRLRQVMDKDSTNRLSHLSLSFQTCSQPEANTSPDTDQPHQLCDHDPYPCWEQLSMAVHSSRTPVIHICPQSEERAEMQPFSRSFSRDVHTENTSSTQPYTTQPPSCLLKNEDLTCFWARQGVRGKWPSLYPQASCLLSCSLRSESLHPHSLLEKAAETEETNSLDKYP